MVDVSTIDPSTSFLGTPTPVPVGLSPTAQHRSRIRKEKSPRRGRPRKQAY